MSKPDWPTELKKPSWRYAFRTTVREFTADGCIDIAAALTYYSVLSIFPALLALVSLLGIVGQGESGVSAILSIVEQIAPGESAALIADPLRQLGASSATGLALAFGIVLAIWSASGYVGAFARGMNRIYEVDEGRPFWKLKPQQLLVTVVGIVLVLVMVLILVVSGPFADALGDLLGVGGSVRLIWDIGKWPVLAAALVIMIAILYYSTPNVRLPKFRWISLGAMFAFAAIVIASVGFSIYIANLANYDRTYGSLAGVIIFLLWLWIVNLALLFGAEFDSELERGRQLQAGIEAEERLQLPARDTTKSDKARQKHEQDVTRGRELRMRLAGASGEPDSAGRPGARDRFDR